MILLVHFSKMVDVKTVIVSVGTSLIASSIVAFLSSIYIQNYKKAEEISEIWGIQSIESKRATINSNVESRMRKAKKHIDIIAYGLKSLRETNSDLIESFLKRGGAVRIITVNPSCETLSIRDMEENKISGSTSDSITKLISWVSSLSKKDGYKISLKCSNYLPTELYYRVDNHIYVGPYQFGKESQSTITLEYRRPGKAFSIYEDYFQSLWDNEEYCVDLNNAHM